MKELVRLVCSLEPTCIEDMVEGKRFPDNLLWNVSPVKDLLQILLMLLITKKIFIEDILWGKEKEKVAQKPPFI